MMLLPIERHWHPLAGWLGLLAWGWCIASATMVSAEPVKNIRSRNEQPVAVRGGVLVLPLIAEKPGDQWPSTLELTLADQSKLTGQVIWIEAAPVPMERHWTEDPRGLQVREVVTEDVSNPADIAAGLGPYLLAVLPFDGSGDLMLGRQKLKPVWHDRPAPRLDVDQPALERVRSPDRPDPDSPFEHWRWAMLADRLSKLPPPPAGNEIEQQVARHFADLWDIGFARLRGQSPRVAEECREVLTNTSSDRQQDLASWLTAPQATNALLDRLLDPDRSDTAVLSDAVAWLDALEPLYLWPVEESGPRVRIAALTARQSPVEAKFNWIGSREEPVAMRIEPGVLSLIEVDRLPLPKRRVGLPVAPEPVPQVLNVEVGSRDYQLTFGARTTPAKPPGVFFRPLSPPLTLGEVQMHLQRAMPEDHQTLAQVRRLSGRWEVFIECRRPNAEADMPAIESETLRAISSLDDLRGIEAVTLLLGENDSSSHPAVWLTIPERGWHQVIKGDNDGTLQVHRRSLADRWYCRVVLPANWLPHPVAGGSSLSGSLQISVVRSHIDLRQLESGPGALLPWRQSPARAAIDLSAWDDMPGPTTAQSRE